MTTCVQSLPASSNCLFLLPKSKELCLALKQKICNSDLHVIVPLKEQLKSAIEMLTPVLMVA
jgi:hypothetical protein